MKNPLVSIIIINKNGHDYLPDCLKTLKKEKYKNKEVILVDNNSSDSSVSEAKEIYPEIKVIKNKTNKGFAEANNIGFKKTKGKYVFLLNNDTKVTTNLIAPLVEQMENDNKIGVIQPKVLLMDKPNKLDSIGSYLTITGFLYHKGFQKRDSKKYQKVMKLFSAKGCAMMTRASLINKIGLFDKKYFAYFEETDFCWRAWIAGYQVIYFPFVYIYHKGSATSSKINYALISYHSFKNRFASIIANSQIPLLAFILPINTILSLIASIGYLLKLQFANAASIIKAMLWSLRNTKYLLKKRKKVASFRKKTDSEIIPQLTVFPKISYYYHIFFDLENFNED